jgi:hypothetical protein
VVRKGGGLERDNGRGDFVCEVRDVDVDVVANGCE